MVVPESFRGAIHVAKGSEVVVEEYQSLADAERGIPIEAHTRFQISSISKQFVAACILLLERDGVLAVVDAVGTWFRGPPSWDGISLADLMAHTAGLGHWPDYAGIDPARPIDDDAFVAALRSRPLPAELPAPHVYSSPGYGLLARVVEKASGVPYARFVTEHVLDPLDMRETFVGNAHGRDNLARGHRAGEELASWDLDSASRGAGDIWTTARDLDRWDVALCSDALLPHDSRAEMFRTRVPIDGLGFVTGYGFGWLTGELHDQPLYLHAGDNPGFMGLNAIVPALQARVIVLSNDDTTDVFTPAIGYLEAIAT